MLMGPGGSGASGMLWVGAWGRAAGLPATAPHGPGRCRGPVLDRVCPSCLLEVQSGLWDLCWYPLKANLRSGVGIKIYADFPPQSAC